MFIGVGILDWQVDIESNRYDASRFVSISQGELALAAISNTDDQLSSAFSTSMMHKIYGNRLFSNYPFTNAFIVNLIILYITCFAFGIQRDNVILRSPLAISFICLPGKEAFVIMSMILFFEACMKGKIRGIYYKAFTSIVIVALLSIGRIPFIPILLYSLLLYWTLIRKKYITLAALYLFLWYIVNDYLELDRGADRVIEESSVDIFGSIRQATIGYGIQESLLRLLVNATYLITMPVCEGIRFYTELKTIGISPYFLYLIAGIWQWLIIVKSISINYFAVIACITIPSMVISACFPFIHTRYLLPIVIFTYSLWRIKFWVNSSLYDPNINDLQVSKEMKRP